MMRAWENRGDTAVWDEPLYAFYLHRTGIDHPGADEVIAAGDTDWRSVVAALTGPVPGGKPVFFHKHMTHHMLEEVDRDWLAQVHNCFLIRDPREVIASYARTRPHVTVSDVGVLQQAEIFAHARRMAGATPLVLDSRDVLEDPRGMLMALCAALDVPFSEKMLSWPRGGAAVTASGPDTGTMPCARPTDFRPMFPKCTPCPGPWSPWPRSVSHAIATFTSTDYTHE